MPCAMCMCVQGQCQVVPLRIHVDKGKGKETSALPSELKLGGGSSATGTVTSTNGAPVLGRLAVGGTQVGFALHGAPQVADKATEALGESTELTHKYQMTGRALTLTHVPRCS